MALIYLDTSAAIKLFKEETESEALELWLPRQGSATVLTSELTRTELRRGLTAADAGDAAHREADEWLADSAFVKLTTATFDHAGRLPHTGRLRSLDALHCAAALGLGAALLAFVAYDKRLLECADALGLPVQSPS